jgi:cob(I)alamin adenosyltransferase
MSSTQSRKSPTTGRVHVYTGNGKGKTTAALGLALRAAGAGIRVYIAQFAKGRPSSELKTLAKHGDMIVLKQFGRDTFIVGQPSVEDSAAARRGFDEVARVISEGRYGLVVLDEGNIALYYGMIDLRELLALLRKRPSHVEVVITGRNAPQELVDAADLVTEMREVKHYSDKGVKARVGIEE